MFNKIKNWLFNDKTDLEQYIESNNPKTVEDVEFWIKQYMNRARLVNQAKAIGNYKLANWYNTYY